MWNQQLNYILTFFFSGTLGFSINLTTNHFAVDYENTEIYQYEVNFIPNEENIGDQRKRLSIHHEFLGTYIFNGTSLFSNKLYSPRVSCFVKFSFTSNDIMSNDFINRNH